MMLILVLFYQQNLFRHVLDLTTPILTDRGYKQIKNIEINDLVLSYNTYSKKLEYKSVLKKLVYNVKNNNDKYILIKYGKNKIYTTTNQKIYTNGKFINASQLKKGDWLLSDKLTKEIITEIKSIKIVDNLIYDIVIADNHNFFANNILVHNFIVNTVYFYVDHMRLTITYTEGSPTNTPTPLPIIHLEKLKMEGVKIN